MTESSEKIKEPETHEVFDSIRPTVDEIVASESRPPLSKIKTRIAALALLTLGGVVTTGAVKGFSSNETGPQNNTTIPAATSPERRETASQEVDRNSMNKPESTHKEDLSHDVKEALKRSLIAANEHNEGLWSEKDLSHKAENDKSMAQIYLLTCPHWILEHANDGTIQVSDKIFGQALLSISQQKYQDFLDQPSREHIGAILEKSMSRLMKMKHQQTIINNLLHYHPDLILYLLPSFKQNGLEPAKLKKLVSAAAQKNVVAAVELREKYEENILPGNFGRNIFRMACNNVATCPKPIKQH